MKGVFIDSQIFTIQTSDDFIKARFEELIARGELNAFLNDAFTEKINREKTKQIKDELGVATTEDLDKVISMLENITKLLEKGVTVANSTPNYNYQPPQQTVNNISPKEVINNETNANSPSEPKPTPKKEGPKKSAFAGMDMSKLMGMANAMKKDK